MKPLPHFAAGLSAAALAALLCSGCSTSNGYGTGGTSQLPYDQVTAEIQGYTDGNIRGTAQFITVRDSLRVLSSVSGLTPGASYAIHVHQFGNCSAPDSSGDHFGAPAEPHGNPLDPLGQHHRGDLPNLVVDSNGVGHSDITTTALSLLPGDRSVHGRSVVVHALADDYVTQPAGNSDGRIACGIIGAGTPIRDTTGIPHDTTVVPTPGY
jgi:Cu-Zn family superoxide dismutase